MWLCNSCATWSSGTTLDSSSLTCSLVTYDNDDDHDEDHDEKDDEYDVLTTGS